MQTSEKDSKTFHKLIKQQRSNHPLNTDILYIGNTKYEGENILEAWSIHFEKLGTPNYDKNIFDLERFRLAKLQNDIILKNQYSKKEIKQTTPEEVKTAIKNLKTGKTSDENGICSEHYKEAVDEVSVEIARRLEYELLPSQNPLQRGFTEGASSLFAAFITTETILVYRLLQILLELSALDAEKAFDTLSHEIMLNKLFHDGIEGDMWILLRNIYQDLSLKVKWNNETSESINILQGVRQGAKLSSLLYKRYNNTILNALSTSNLGAKLGNIHVGSPTCADDIALLGKQSDIQAMLGIIEFHTKRDMDWAEYRGECFLFSIDRRTWVDAQAYLVTDDNAEKHNFIRQILSVLDGERIQNFFVGATDQAFEGQWRWLETGVPLKGYTAWGPGKPDNNATLANKQNCLMYYWVDDDVFWTDHDCSDRHAHFICEKQNVLKVFKYFFQGYRFSKCYTDYRIKKLISGQFDIKWCEIKYLVLFSKFKLNSTKSVIQRAKLSKPKEENFGRRHLK
ncbi:COLEC12 [Mytilus coruscus]|uniref:COLEC12 n=1 Tax=Mytilus coruscus TaxID=42192 RepID=A0A6J8B2V6_MYTCO|nr:COLEC12 [Mytilus coruscus]